ncbi:alpha/beta hydrolase [Streptococcus iniae]|uniref:alpha/beta fold hydrolase n=1 Tax=Streptococcus iniae TaxID=1346 RepID=UPI0008DB0A8B|nr:alpha/beta hydrolase [Streptococcus iniae]OHX26445.1 alpha/beta hydrolase [Streptococcus iniae]RLV28393.1 alpha/beta hydrolase [Streptococcus iniae]
MRLYYTCQNGQKLYYEIHGQGSPIVFFHGNGLSSQYFKHQKVLAKNYQLIMIDSLGQGQSDALEHMVSFADIAKEIRSLLHHLHLSSYVIVGHSDGANLAIAYAQLYPDNVAALLLNAGNIQFRGLTYISRLLISYKVCKLSLLSKIFPTLKNAYYVAHLMTINQHLKRSPFKQAKPVYVLVGEKDMIKEKHSLKIAKLYQKSRLIILPKFGHHIATKDPEVFNQFINDLMNELERKNTV